MASLHDRVALITGGGTGIGAAAAQLFARAGAHVALLGRRERPLKATTAQISQAGGQASSWVCDVSDPAEARRVVAQVTEQHGRLDILFNNAGIFEPGPLVECTVSAWERTFAVNVTAPMVLCQAAQPWLASSPGGVVLNNLSTLAQRPVAGTSAYSASKAALLSMTQALALEWAPLGIRVVAIAPGVVDTPMHDEQRLSSMASAHPLGRVGTCEEIAQAALFLVSDASAWTTGSVLNVDGGIGLA